MSRVFAVYVAASTPAQLNLETGLAGLLWGWRDSVLDVKDHRAIAESIAPGDWLVMGTKGPNPRVAAGGWADARLERVLLLRFTSTLYQGADPVWPDEVGQVLYPNRADFEVIEDSLVPDVAPLAPAVLEALRWSANTQGSLVLASVQEGAGPLAPGALQEIAAAPVEGDEPGELAHRGPFDAVAQVLVRREQRKIRARKFGNRPALTCDLCGRTLPARIIRAAHVKRRSACTPKELRDLRNIIAACALGCDELFEHGYLVVDDAGRVAAGRPATGDLGDAVAALAGRACPAHGRDSREHFAWHRRSHAGGSPD